MSVTLVQNIHSPQTLLKSGSAPAQAPETKQEPAAGSIKADSLALDAGRSISKGAWNGAKAGALGAAATVSLPLIMSTMKHHDGSVVGGMMMVGSVAAVVGSVAGAVVGGTSAALSDNPWKAAAIGAGAGALVLGGAMLALSGPSMFNIKEGAALMIGAATAAGAVVGGSSAYAGAKAVTGN